MKSAINRVMNELESVRAVTRRQVGAAVRDGDSEDPGR